MEKSFKAGDKVVLRNGTVVDDLVNRDGEKYPLYSEKLDKTWARNGNYYFNLVTEFDIVDYYEMPTGGSSDYYKLPEDVRNLSDLLDKKTFPFPYDLLFLHCFNSIEKNNLRGFSELKDLIRLAETATRFDENAPLFDFNRANIVKAIYRMGAKNGTTIDYDKEKIRFFLDEILKYDNNVMLKTIRKQL